MWNNRFDTFKFVIFCDGYCRAVTSSSGKVQKYHLQTTMKRIETKLTPIFVLNAFVCLIRLTLSLWSYRHRNRSKIEVNLRRASGDKSSDIFISSVVFCSASGFLREVPEWPLKKRLYISSAVSPLLFRKDKIAPDSIKISMISTFPLYAAACNGVLPSMVALTQMSKWQQLLPVHISTVL